MKSAKYRILLIIITLIFCMSLTVNANPGYENQFNKYGFKDMELQRVIKEEISSDIKLFSNSLGWESFPDETNIPLDKRWTVLFSREFNYDSIAAISISKGSEFIPVTISKSAADKLVVFPKDKFSGDTKYSLRIVLENGRKYKKDFITTKEYRDADIEPNDSYGNASYINNNERVFGKITKGDVDIYKVEIPKEGTLSIDLLSLQQKGLGLRIYGEDYEKGAMRQFSNKSKGNLTEGVRAGIYYIYITGYYNDTESDYELETSYTPSEYDDDEAGNTFISAKLIDVNETYTGNIGYKSANGWGNYKDYYKVEIPKEGTLSIDLLSLQQKGLGLRIYGEDYEKGAMKQFSNKSKGNLTEGVRAGTYYIYITGYYNDTYSPYELKVKYTPSEYDDDGAGNTFISAKLIDVNKTYTGNIGYKSANGWGNYKDYYKVEIPKEGTLSIDLLSLQQKGLGLRIYGEDYEKGAMRQFSNKSKGNLTEEVHAGTYYIYITGYYNDTYSPYVLDISFY